jgi:hypothetical protein
MAYHRRTMTKVAGGRPLRADRRAETPNIWIRKGGSPVVDKERPGRGYRHILSKSDILEFIELIPNWGELSAGLRGILLTEGDACDFGWYHEDGVIGLCAWPRGLWVELPHHFHEENAGVLSRLGVDCTLRKKGVLARFTEGQARAFMLLNIFLHELGHHHDRMTTASRRYASRGEVYAEDYALHYEHEISDAYMRRFSLD